MDRYSSCLGSLPEGQRRVLELRGGTDGPARSRRATARELNISTRETAKRERGGLRGLRRACGGGGSGSASSGSSGSAAALVAGGAPALQPAVMLAGAPALRRTADMQEGEQGVAGASASGGESSSGGSGESRQYASIIPGTSLQPVAGDASAAIWIPILLLVALVTAGLIASRRRPHGEPAVVASSIAPAAVAPERSTAPSAAEPEPDDEPVPDGPAVAAAPFPVKESEPETAAVKDAEPVEKPAVASQPDWQWPSAPERPQQDAAHRIADRAKRPATAAAAGLVGVLVRELLKRRRR